MFMEAVYHGLGIYEVEISDGPKAIIRTSSRGLDARRKWLAASQRSLFVAARTRAREQDRAASRPISKADVLAGPELQALDTAMKQELDYGLGDVMDLAAGTITLIEERPRWIMSMPKTLFIQRLESASGLTPEVLRSMLAARTMTKAQDDAFDPKQILPIERYWRPSRLISRPFVEVEGADE
jgi:hypothetical protein